MRGIPVVSLAVVCSLTAPPLSAQASPSVDACPLVTAAEVSAVLGITSLPGRPFLGSHVTCYFAADTGYATTPSVSVNVMTPEMFHNQGQMGGPLASHPLTGLGDEAFYISSGNYTKVSVLKGGRACSVTIVPGGKVKAAQVLDMEKSLAQKAVARL